MNDEQTGHDQLSNTDRSELERRRQVETVTEEVEKNLRKKYGWITIVISLILAGGLYTIVINVMNDVVNDTIENTIEPAKQAALESKAQILETNIVLKRARDSLDETEDLKKQTRGSLGELQSVADLMSTKVAETEAEFLKVKDLNKILTEDLKRIKEDLETASKRVGGLTELSTQLEAASKTVKELSEKSDDIFETRLRTVEDAVIQLAEEADVQIADFEKARDLGVETIQKAEENSRVDVLIVGPQTQFLPYERLQDNLRTRGFTVSYFPGTSLRPKFGLSPFLGGFLAPILEPILEERIEQDLDLPTGTLKSEPKPAIIYFDLSEVAGREILEFMDKDEEFSKPRFIHGGKNTYFGSDDGFKIEIYFP